MGTVRESSPCALDAASPHHTVIRAGAQAAAAAAAGDRRCGAAREAQAAAHAALHGGICGRIAGEDGERGDEPVVLLVLDQQHERWRLGCHQNMAELCKPCTFSSMVNC